MRISFINLQKILNIFTVLFVFTSSSSFAVQQGITDHKESYGEVELAIEIAELVKLSDLDDLSFSRWDNQGDLIQSDDVCIFSNSARGSYNVMARGSGSGGGFVVDDGINKVKYQVYWQDTINSSSNGVKLEPNITAYNRSNGNSKYFDCNGNNNARLTIVFLREELKKSIGAHYSGNLVIQIAPI